MLTSRELTIVLPHFCNLGMLDEQQKIWASYPEGVRAQLHVVVVDDCSPKGHRPSRKSVIVEGLGSFRIYRLTKHVRWNWLACRNLGAKMAQTEWMLLTDIDHALPLQTVQSLQTSGLDPRWAYRFARVDAPRTWPYDISECKPYKPHNDTWLMTREMFFSDGVGGYDERLSGLYGTSGEFKDRVFAAAKAVVALSDVVIRYPREIIADASTSPKLYTRKNDPSNDSDLELRKAQRSKIEGWRPLHGLIPYEEVFSSIEVTV